MEVAVLHMVALWCHMPVPPYGDLPRYRRAPSLVRIGEYVKTDDVLMPGDKITVTGAWHRQLGAVLLLDGRYDRVILWEPWEKSVSLDLPDDFPFAVNHESFSDGANKALFRAMGRTYIKNSEVLEIDRLGGMDAFVQHKMKSK